MVALSLLPTTVTIALGLAMRRWPHRERGRLSLDGDVVRLDDRVIAKRSEIAGGFAGARKGSPVVRLVRGWAGIDVQVPSDADAQALLEALHVDRAHPTLRLVASAWSPRAAALGALALTPVLAALVAARRERTP